MPECVHSLTVCATCGGLEITEWTPLGGIGTIELDGQLLPVTSVFIAPVAEPCDKEQQADDAR